MSAEELNLLWERRNLAYFDRRQRKLAEARQQRQHQQQEDDLSEGDDYSSSSCSSDSSNGTAAAQASSSSSPPPQRGQPLTRPPGYVCAADDPQWQALTSRNIMGDYDPERASREPAYHDAWVSCERLVNMHKSCAAGNFIPTNPRLAALLEHRRIEVARERFEEAEALKQFPQAGAQQEHDNDMMLDDSASQELSSFKSLSTQATAEQAAEYKRLNQAHRLQQQDSEAHAQDNLKSPPLEKSSAGEKSAHPPVKNNFYMALPFPTPQLPKSVYCDTCNCELFTSPLAKRFFCQTCGCVACVPVSPNDVDASFDEKMQDAEDEDHQLMCY